MLTRWIKEQEMEKQKLLFHQTRLLDRGVAEMVLLHISACKGIPSEMVMKTLKLGIAILRGGNINIQLVIIVYPMMCHWSMSVMISTWTISTGYVESPKRKKRCWFFYVHCWTYEFLQVYAILNLSWWTVDEHFWNFKFVSVLFQRSRFGCVRTKHEGGRLGCRVGRCGRREEYARCRIHVHSLQILATDLRRT